MRVKCWGNYLNQRSQATAVWGISQVLFSVETQLISLLRPAQTMHCQNTKVVFQPSRKGSENVFVFGIFFSQTQNFGGCASYIEDVFSTLNPFVKDLSFGGKYWTNTSLPNIS